MGERPVADRGGVRRAAGVIPIAGGSAAHSGGPGPDLVLPRLGTLREPQPREYQHKRELFGSIANGSVLYRDVSPGHYHIAPQSYGQDFNQDKDVDLAPGQQVYCSVASLRSWEEGGDVAVFDRDTFYIRLMPPEVAQAAIVRSRSGI
jgi:hypothetical protein